MEITVALTLSKKIAVTLSLIYICITNIGIPVITVRITNFNSAFISRTDRSH